MMEKSRQLQSHVSILDDTRDSIEPSFTTCANAEAHARFSGKRIMPIIFSLAEEEVMVFPSEEALYKYKHTNYERDPIDPHGLGLPLFKLMRKHRFLRLGKKPHYVIYKYLLQKNGAPALQGSEVVVSDSTHTVYMLPFCYVYREKDSNLARYVFEFAAELRSQELELVEIPNRKQYRGSINGCDLLWRPHDDERDEYELQMDINKVMRMFAQGEHTAPAQQRLSIVASYTLEDRDYLPKKHLRYGDLVFLEQSPVGKLETLGITSVPVLTQLLACHGLILQHVIEKVVYREKHQAERNTPAAQYERRRGRTRTCCSPRTEVWDSIFAH